jgi:ACS family hexuronate transporter-like MFS transporter
MVPWITVRFGWPMAFIVTGALGFLWMIGWWILYETPERHPRLSRSELAYVRSDRLIRSSRSRGWNSCVIVKPGLS